MPKRPYKVLILHAIRSDFRKTTIDHIHCFPAYRPGHLYAYHHLLAPVTPALMSFPFDAVVINYCFLAQRDSSIFPEILEKYAFLNESEAVKIAIPQDDYTLSGVLDEWLFSLKTDVIYSPVTHDLEALYPRCSGSTRIKHALTGYSHPKDLARLGRFVQPYRERPIDVGARVRYLPPYFGKAAVLKGRAAERFRNAAAEAGFAIDISTRPEDVFAGDDWFRFLGSCRYTFAAMGGASLNDPRGAIRERVNKFLQAHPEATFETVEEACFAGLDVHDFSAVSPRLFEAAAARTGLILLEGRYVEGLEPYRHYIPLKEDFSNLGEVFALMRDDAAAEAMIEAAYQHLVAGDDFTYGAFVDDVLDEVRARRPAPRPATADDFAGLVWHYDQLAASQRLVMQAPPHWSEVGRWVGARARQRGQLASLAAMAELRLRGMPLRSLMAAEMATFGALDQGLAAAAVEAVNGLAVNPEDLAALAAVLAQATGNPTGGGDLTHDWRLCEYFFDPP